MKYIRFTILSILIFVVFGCVKEKHEKPVPNIFTDPVIKEIFNLQDKRDAEDIYRFLKDRNPLYRKYAALSFGTIQDIKSVPKLLPLLNDLDYGVRESVAYSLGQIGSSEAEVSLQNSFEKEINDSVKNQILEAIGKCGSKESLEFLVTLSEKRGNISYSEGIARGFYRFLLRKIFSDKVVGKVVGFLNGGYPYQTRFYSANFLARIKEYDLTPYFNAISKSIKNETDVFIKMNLALSLWKIKSRKSLEILKAILDSNEDYRVKVNAVRTLKNFKLKSYIDIVQTLLNNPDRNVRLVISQLILDKNRGELKCGEILKFLRTEKDIRIRSLLLSSALKLSKDKRKVSNLIYNYYKKSENIFEKGFLLQSLSYYIENLKLISSETFGNSDKFIASSGMTAIAEMIKRRSKNRNAKNTAELFGTNHFFLIFKRGINSGDSALMTISASALRDPELKLKDKIKDLSFLKKALKLCKLPEDVEPYLELKKTLNYFEGVKKKVIFEKFKAKPIDWKLVKTISSKTKVRIRTIRGDIIVVLYINNAPGSVSNFIGLIKKGFFKDVFFHRVVPNFVIQDGCPRGDGWGGPGYSIRSDFSPDGYSEGTVGMASAGKDTEGSQWFITHSPTPHLDGRYSVIGRVIKGMNVVHKICVGDKIIDIKIL